jgi:rubredoxin
VAIEGSDRQAVDTLLSHFRCSGCGYGASRRMAPDRCPMCSGSVWEYDALRPFTSPPMEQAGDLPQSRLPTWAGGRDG